VTGATPNEKVQQLQDKLCHAAKENSNRKFHALYDKIHRTDTLQEAWSRVRANKGASGVDGETLADIEKLGVESFLQECQEQLKQGATIPSL
jgi:RNA-directed DNA polymerase